MSKRALSWLKAIVALAVAVGIGVAVLPGMFAILNAGIVDQGTRPLVMVTTSGGNRDYGMRVRNFVDEDGGFRFVVSIVNDDVTYGSTGNTFLVDVDITLALPQTEARMRCGPEKANAEAVEVSALNEGTTRMLRADAVSGRYSSTNQEPAGGENAPPSPSSLSAADVDSLLAKLTLQRFSTAMWLLDDEYEYSSDAQNENDGSVFSVECTLEKQTVWKAADPTNPVDQPQATLFAPEFNFGPQSGVSDYQRDMEVSLSVDRAEGLDVVRSYPEADVGSMNWFIEYGNRWQGKVPEDGIFGYTNAPTFLVANRDATGRDQNYLLWGGVAIGLAVTLFIRGLNDLADATLLRKGD